jgi:uncharacterized membrane protein YfcA
VEFLLFIITMLAVGCGVGILSAALGIGGGILMVPAFLTLYPQMDIHTAKGSSMFIIIFVATYNALRMNRGDMRNPMKLINSIAIGSIIGGFIAGWLTAKLTDAYASWIFIALLLFAAARTFLLKEKEVTEDQVQKRTLTAATIGLLSGIVAGATGTGGGAVFVPFALMAGIVSNKRVVALSNAVMAVAAAAGTIAYLTAPKTTDMDWTIGLTNISLAPFVILGAVAAAPLGRKLNHHLSFNRRRIVMAFLLVLITIRLALRTLA